MEQSLERAQYNEGLRSYLLATYRWVIYGLISSGVAAYAASMTGFTEVVKTNGWVALLLFIVPFALLFFIAGVVKKNSSAEAVAAAYLALAATMGAMLSVTISAYTGESVIGVFVVTTVTFLAVSLWGYTTKRDLTGMGAFFTMGLIGLIVASLAQAFFFQSSAMGFSINVIGVLLFVGLIAYDTQTMVAAYSPTGDNRKTIIGNALSLYLDFINLFIHLLQLLGEKK